MVDSVKIIHTVIVGGLFLILLDLVYGFYVNDFPMFAVVIGGFPLCLLLIYVFCDRFVED